MKRFRVILLGAAILLLASSHLFAGAVMTITNGTEYVDVQVDPYFLDPTDMDVIDFYSYGNPDYASANTGFEQSETALCFLTLDNQDPAHYALVVIMDVANDATGGDTDLYVSGLDPATTFTAVSDDPGECGSVQPDGTAECHWYWSPCCTDGVAYDMGNSPDFTLTLDFVFGAPNYGIETLRFITFDPCNQGELLFLDLDYTQSLTITSIPIPGDMIDCNENNQPDYCDLLNGTSLDCNLNDIPDECDIADGTSEDCDYNGIPDECEIDDNDCNQNGVLDACELFDNDCNTNGIPDDCDIADGTSLDCNLDGMPEECQLDGNDCNQNGIPDDCDIADGTSEDCNLNGIPDECELIYNDCNINFVPDDCDIADGTSLDCNLDGMPDECQLEENDCNFDQIPDDCQLEGNDCNQNWIPDDCELDWNDCNMNNVPDDCDIADGTSEDCQPNGVPDECDIADGWSLDLNQNGIPDECEDWTEIEVPEAFALSQNYPNPFNPTTTIEFAVAEPGRLNITVYDLAGKAVATLVDGQVPVGYHTVEFDASDLASGVYIYVMKSVAGVESRKMVLVK